MRLQKKCAYLIMFFMMSMVAVFGQNEEDCTEQYKELLAQYDGDTVWVQLKQPYQLQDVYVSSNTYKLYTADGSILSEIDVVWSKESSYVILMYEDYLPLRIEYTGPCDTQLSNVYAVDHRERTHCLYVSTPPAPIGKMIETYVSWINHGMYYNTTIVHDGTSSVEIDCGSTQELFYVVNATSCVLGSTDEFVGTHFGFSVEEETSDPSPTDCSDGSTSTCDRGGVSDLGEKIINVSHGQLIELGESMVCNYFDINDGSTHTSLHLSANETYSFNVSSDTTIVDYTGLTCRSDLDDCCETIERLVFVVDDPCHALYVWGGVNITGQDIDGANIVVRWSQSGIEKEETYTDQFGKPIRIAYGPLSDSIKLISLVVTDPHGGTVYKGDDFKEYNCSESPCLIDIPEIEINASTFRICVAENHEVYINNSLVNTVQGCFDTISCLPDTFEISVQEINESFIDSVFVTVSVYRQSADCENIYDEDRMEVLFSNKEGEQLFDLVPEDIVFTNEFLTFRVQSVGIYYHYTIALEDIINLDNQCVFIPPVLGEGETFSPDMITSHCSWDTTIILQGNKLSFDLGEDMSTCEPFAMNNLSIHVDGIGDYSINWEWYGVAGAETGVGLAVNPDDFQDTSGMYTATITDIQGCTTSDEIFIDYAPVDVEFIPDIYTACHDGPIMLMVPENEQTYRYISPHGDTIYTYNLDLSEATYAEHHGMWYIYTTNGICETTDSFLVEVAQAPVNILEQQVEICEGNSLSFTEQLLVQNTSLDQSDLLYTWILPDGEVVHGLEHMIDTIGYAAAGWYTLTTTTSLGCSEIDSVLVNVIYCCENIVEDIYMPNIFSPNNDGSNDYLGPMGKTSLEIRSFQIYDRWGSKTHEAINFDLLSNEVVGYPCWDGRINGQEANRGVYVWVIEVFCPFSGEIITMSGDVMLMRK